MTLSKTKIALHRLGVLLSPALEILFAELLSEYIDNHYDYPVDDDDEGGGGFHGGFSPYSFPEILEDCIEPTVRDTLAVVGKLVVWCVIFRVTAQSAR